MQGTFFAQRPCGVVMVPATTPCRDVRRTFDKDDAPQAQTVSLCRTEIGTGAHLWIVAVASVVPVLLSEA
jgi:hypothetical protein